MINTLICDSVMDGAFFHPDFQVPEKKMGHHARLYMVMPAHKFPDLIMVHTQPCFGFFKAFLNIWAMPATTPSSATPAATSLTASPA
ncbi:MAG: hypothetical protein WC836_24065 [Desulfobacula sp.]